MKKLVALMMVLSVGACQSTVTQTSTGIPPERAANVQLKEVRTIEKQLSYVDIIERLNEANIKNKDNPRVKEIVKDFIYNVGDDDSRNTARQKALNEVKKIILEEVGVYVESYLEIDQFVSKHSRNTKFRQEIKNLTAGIIKTKILHEEFNGKQFYIKASVLVDPDSVSQGISEIVKLRANKEQITKLESLLLEKKSEIDMRSTTAIKLEKALASQELKNLTMKKSLNELEQKYHKAQLLLAKYKIEEQKVKSKLDVVTNRINSKTNKAMQYIVRGMTYDEMVELAGKPRSSSNAYPGEPMYNYGKLWVQFSDGVVGCITRFEGEKTACKYYGKNSAYPSKYYVVK